MNSSAPHIGIFGRCNSGKSTLFNALLGQPASIVSPVSGTTTDVVRRNIEWPGIGAAVLMDTAGLDDSSELGAPRVAATLKVASEVDLGLVVLSGPDDTFEREFAKRLKRAVFVSAGAPAVLRGSSVAGSSSVVPGGDSSVLRGSSVAGGSSVVSGGDSSVLRGSSVAGSLSVVPGGDSSVLRGSSVAGLSSVVPGTELAGVFAAVAEALRGSSVAGSSSVVPGTELAGVFAAVAEALRGSSVAVDMTAGLLVPGQRALLVMPQDSGAPEGRLISAQTQVIRHLLDKHCLVVCCQMEEYPSALLRGADLVITDSQVLGKVIPLTPDDVPVTTFSILMAGAKGRLDDFVSGAAALSSLRPDSHVLIAESCTHVPASEDIGTVKIPRLLRRRFGEGLVIDNVRGAEFPEDLSRYDLVIHCGGCMQTRQFMLSRQDAAAARNVPMTNYGIAIACLLSDFSRLSFPAQRD